MGNDEAANACDEEENEVGESERPTCHHRAGAESGNDGEYESVSGK